MSRRIYYSLKDCISIAEFTEIDKIGYGSTVDLDTILGDLIAPYNPIKDRVDFDSVVTSNHVKECWKQVYSWYGEQFTIYIDKGENELDPTNDEIITAFSYWFVTLLNKFKDTQEYYETVLNIYTQNKNKLMDKLRSSNSGQTRFNETPQNIAVGYDGPSYATNITTSEGTTEVDNATTMGRLKEIQESYTDILGQWAKSFKNLFIERSNVNE